MMVLQEKASHEAKGCRCLLLGRHGPIYTMSFLLRQNPAIACLADQPPSLTVCSLNSVAYSCFGMSFTSFFLSLRRSYDSYLDKKQFVGKIMQAK